MGQLGGGGGESSANWCNPPVILLLVVPRPLFCFIGSLIVLDAVWGYVLLFLFDIKIDNKYKNMFNIRLAGNLYGEKNCSPGCCW